MSFIKEFKRVQKLVTKTSDDKGFLDFDKWIKQTSPNGVGADIRGARCAQKLMMAVGELSEAVESLRKGDPADSHIPKFKGSEAELADVIIRVMEYAETNGLRLAEAIVAKATYNKSRPHKHGGKKF